MTPASPHLNKTLDAWLARRTGSARGGLRLAVAAGLAAGLLVIVSSALLAWTINAVVVQGAALADVWIALAAMLPVFAARFAFTLASERLALRAAARVRGELRAELVRKIHALGPAWLKGEATGALASRAVTGIDALEGYYARWLPNRALTSMLPIAILVVVFPIDWVSGLVLTLTAPLIPVFMILVGKRSVEMNQRQWHQLTRLAARFLDTLQGLTTLKLFNASRREAQVVARLSETYRQSTMQVLRIAFLSAVVLEFLSTVSIAMVAVLIGFNLLYGKVHFQPAFLVLLLAPEFYLPLRTLGTHYHARMEAIGAVEHIAAILDTPQPHAQAERTPLAAAQQYGIAFDAVSFAYDANQPALDHVSFALEPGRITALVGPSGAGKSTVLNLLLGFVANQQGSIRINGQSLAEVDPASWLAQVAWVPQRAHVFLGSVRDNIQIANPAASFDAVRAAAQQAGADDFIMALPNGYDTPLGERGAGLSGGQIQRLALARAFLKDAPVLLLDEPTAHLDSATQAHIHEALRRLAHGRTVLLVAHRPATARLADRIVVLDGGKVAQSGTHEALIGEGGLYRELIGAGVDSTGRTSAATPHPAAG